MPGQLAFPFGVEPALGREDFIVAACNEQAFRFVERWPEWPARAAAVYGPQGCGKSHLVSVWQLKSRAGRSTASLLSPALLQGLPEAVAIEDLDREQDRLDEERGRVLLALFERPVGTLLLTGRKPPSEWPAPIGDLRSRFDSLLAFPMWAPDDTLLSELIRKHFADRQLQVSDNVVTRILMHVVRTPAAVAAFVARADSKALSEKRPVSERLVMELVATEERPLSES
jgi:chromosomal replication initiation ATPase DnaA